MVTASVSTASLEESGPLPLSRGGDPVALGALLLLLLLLLHQPEGQYTANP